MIDFEEDSLSENSESETGNGSDENFKDNTLKRKLNEKAGKRKTKKSKSDLYKPPTTEELNRLQENENLFNSNLFRLQIEELLGEVKVKQKYVTAFEIWYEKFVNFINNLSEYDFVGQTKNKKKNYRNTAMLQEIVNNLCVNCKSDLTEISSIQRPTNVNIFGKYKLNASIGSKLEVDIKLFMAKSYFRVKDYLNNRYILKHNYYASYIYTELKKSKLCSKICYLLENKDIGLPVLIVTPSDCEKVSVKIHIVPENNTINQLRFEPIKNNVKINIYDDNFNINEELLKTTATPFYNATLAKNVMLDVNYSFLESSLSELKNVQDGIKLLTVWLKQRFTSDSYKGFTEELLLFTMLYLVLKKRINKHMSSYQIIRNFWYFLSTTDWSENLISICDDVKEEHLQQYKQHFDLVFLDKSGHFNLAAFLDVSIYKQIQKESQIAVNLLDRVQFNSFSALFMMQMPYNLQYDAILTIKDEYQFSKVLEIIPEDVKCQHIGVSELLIAKTVCNLLKKGLNKRIKNIVPQYDDDNLMEDGGSEAKQIKFDKLVFGINLDPEHAFKVIEIGPPANDEKAAEFRMFWGDLAHCRRFNDGSINEAVYFEAKSYQEKRKIFKTIIDFVLTKKLNLKEHHIFCDQLETFIQPYKKSTVEEPTLKIINVFDELTKLLRSLTLPLDITAIHGKSDVFCYSDLFPPLPVACKPGGKVTTIKDDNIVFKDVDNVEWLPKYCPPLECVIHLSLHSKWPNNLEALKHIKTAFYIKISELLKTKYDIKSNVHHDFFDIYYKGYIFRIYLFHPKEVGFLKKQVDSTGLVSYKDTEESMNYEKEFDITCKINGALNGIHAQFPSFGPSNTLIKRWLRSQLIDNFYIPDIVINMLNASIYLNNVHFNSSNLPQLQFLRFLKFIQGIDWNLNPIILNFNDEISREEMDIYENNFHQNRDKYPPMYIITPYDNGKSVFTINTCGKEVLRRISILAVATYKILLEKMSSKATEQLLKPILIPNIDGYNLLIHLKPFLNSRRNEHIEYNVKADNSLESESSSNFNGAPIPIVGFNPVDLYLKELRSNYGEFAYFFHNSYGGCVIAVLWKPDTFKEKEFKVSSVSGHILNPSNKLIFNEDAIIEDFYILGNGLVKTIDKR